jgi:hypothetical protein
MAVDRRWHGEVRGSTVADLPGHYASQGRLSLPTGLPRQETIIECMASGIGGMANTKTMIEQAYSAFNKRDRVGPSL